MENVYKIIYGELVVAIDLQKIDKVAVAKIFLAINNKLKFKPEVFGKPLRHSFKNHRTLRVGDYRVVFRIDTVAKIVIVIAIEHRSVIYRLIRKRIGR